MNHSNRSFVRYRFKDSMGCVFYKTFYTDREARLWYERNKKAYTIKEFNSMGIAYKHRNLDTVID